MLQVKNANIVDEQNRPVRLRGVCIGGWMCGEDFMMGYPGSEHRLRDTLAKTIGPEKTRFLFERWMDYFFNEDDARFIAQCGANVVRIALNYRHFESDQHPFQYLESGFARLDQALQWCAKHGLWAILDMHAAPGWQNTDWHCDNPQRGSLLWEFSHFQDRLVTLWEEFARRYKGNAAVAGYDLLNEPLTDAPQGRFSYNHPPNFKMLDAIYRRTVQAIRAIDPDHIIFLEGDGLAQRYDGLEPPFAENIVYSSHPYSPAAMAQGEYPGRLGGPEGERWDYERQHELFHEHQGTVYAREHGVPLWVGEFGCVFGGPPEDHEHRVRALSDQIKIIEEFGAHWTTWNYKDIGAMGWLRQGEDSAYCQAIAPVLAAKRKLMTDQPASLFEVTEVHGKLTELGAVIQPHLPAGVAINPGDNVNLLAQLVLNVYTGHLLQPAYAQCFAGLSEKQIDIIMSSWALSNCQARQGFIKMLQGFFKQG